jgi:hypothetical protein
MWFQGIQADKINFKASSFNIETTQEQEVLGRTYDACFPSNYIMTESGTTVCIIIDYNLVFRFCV